MSGNNNSGGQTPPPEKKKQPKGADPEDRCELAFDVDLSAVRLQPLRALQIGTLLDVSLVEEGNFESVVCRRQAERDVVGTLAAFEGLDDLITVLDRETSIPLP
jgi:hypothetical protein